MALINVTRILSPPCREKYCFSPCVHMSVCLINFVQSCERKLLISSAYFGNFTYVLSVWRCATGLCVILRLIVVTFLHFELGHFFGLTSTKAYIHWVFCERNSSYNFSEICWKLLQFFFIKVWKFDCSFALILDKFLSLFSQFGLSQFLLDFYQSIRNCLGQFREIPWNQTTDEYRGSTLITRVITWHWRHITWRWRHRNHVYTITSVIAAKQTA